MDKQYKINEFAKMINVSVRTLQRWDNEGTLKAFRTPTNRRYYTHSQYLAYIGNSSKQEENKRKVVIYTRASNRGQKDDLVNQVEFLTRSARIHLPLRWGMNCRFLIGYYSG